jgi:thioredoxin 1
MEFITKEELDVLNNKVVILFWAEWCNHCMFATSYLNEFKEKFSEIDFFLINFDTENDLIKEYDIIGVPTIIIMKNHIVLEKLVGLREKETYHQLIEKLKNEN